MTCVSPMEAFVWLGMGWLYFISFVVAVIIAAALVQAWRQVKPKDGLRVVDGDRDR